jgi:hypothetical protein
MRFVIGFLILTACASEHFADQCNGGHNMCARKSTGEEYCKCVSDDARHPTSEPPANYTTGPSPDGNPLSPARGAPGHIPGN